MFIEHLLCTNPGTSTQILRMKLWSSAACLRRVNHKAGTWSEVWLQITFRDDRDTPLPTPRAGNLEDTYPWFACLILPSSAPSTASSLLSYCTLHTKGQLVNSLLLEALPGPTWADPPSIDLWKLVHASVVAKLHCTVIIYSPVFPRAPRNPQRQRLLKSPICIHRTGPNAWWRAGIKGRGKGKMKEGGREKEGGAEGIWKEGIQQSLFKIGEKLSWMWDLNQHRRDWMLAFPCWEIGPRRITRKGMWGCVVSPSGLPPGLAGRRSQAEQRS